MTGYSATRPQRERDLLFTTFRGWWPDRREVLGQVDQVDGLRRTGPKTMGAPGPMPPLP